MVFFSDQPAASVHGTDTALTREAPRPSPQHCQRGSQGTLSAHTTVERAPVRRHLGAHFSTICALPSGCSSRGHGSACRRLGLAKRGPRPSSHLGSVGPARRRAGPRRPATAQPASKPVVVPQWKDEPLPCLLVQGATPRPAHCGLGSVQSPTQSAVGWTASAVWQPHTFGSPSRERRSRPARVATSKKKRGRRVPPAS